MKFSTFTRDGVLPPGDYPLTISELRRSLLVKGPRKEIVSWDREWRLFLVDNLEVLAGHLWSVGITDLYINGSFVENKAHPNDIDGYFICDLLSWRNVQSELLLVDDCWTWDSSLRRPYRGLPKKQLPMWHKYRVELYPHFGQLAGIRDEFGNDQQFPAAFRKTRGAPPIQKGIVKLLKEGGRKR
ncbi:MAG: hypothetical protein RDU59_11845 [Thermodesulfobacteriota bacterium]|nr:hypothetical protein [Thermodesulfobacteriota bacterium]MDQ7839169.1 hypothetical protein [Thermodesulfobacteriota bacterium]